MWHSSLGIGLLLIAATTAVADTATYQCQSDSDCSLNGVCIQSSKHQTHSHCVCDAGWRGPDCGELDVQPAKRDSGYNRTSENISSWGSRIVADPHQTDLYHLFLAEFTHHCGLDYWSPYSRVIRAQSTSPDGPYTFTGEVVGAFAHNPTVIWDPTERLWLLYYIGCEAPAADLSPNCSTPSTFTCGPGNTLNGESGISVASSSDLVHWELRGQVIHGMNNTDWDADTTNPSPAILSSHGSHSHAGGAEDRVLLAYRGCPFNCPGPELMSLAIADHFLGPYERLNHNEPIFAAPAEDPFIWQDKRGHWHMLMHSLEADGGFGSGPKVGRHAYATSWQGSWTFGNRSLAYNTTVQFEDGVEIDYFRRERPQLFFSDDEQRTPLYLTSGVQEKNSSMSYSVIVPLGRANHRGKGHTDNRLIKQ